MKKLRLAPPVPAGPDMSNKDNKESEFTNA
jgi:hypothetical protein